MVEIETHKITDNDLLEQLANAILLVSSTRTLIDGEMTIEKNRDDATGWYDEVTIRARFTDSR